MPANIETDPFFVLLTDALRAGPGSAQWRQAVASLRQQGLEGADEHRLLIEIRENLEAGRDYRAVRAGPGFTRKVMGEIENEKSVAGKARSVPTATLIALLSGILILSAIAFVVWKVSSVSPSGQAAIDDLEKSSQGFVDKVAAADFTGSIPDGWRLIGSLKLSAAEGLRPDPQAAQDGRNLGGGVVFNTPVPGTQPFAMDVAIHAPTATPALLLEAFVTTDSSFNPDKATSAHDLVWQLRDKNQQVLINGGGTISGGPAGDASPLYHAGDSIRLIVGKEVAIIEVVPAGGGKPQRLWAGPHEMGGGPRYVGVRFLQTGVGGKSDLSVQEIKVTTKGSAD